MSSEAAAAAHSERAEGAGQQGARPPPDALPALKEQRAVLKQQLKQATKEIKKEAAEFSISVDPQ